MDSLIEQRIVDFHERPLPRATRRAVDLPALSGKIDAVIGMRRTGKAWFLFQTMQRYLREGAPMGALLCLNFDDERLLPWLRQNLEQSPTPMIVSSPIIRIEPAISSSMKFRTSPAGRPD